MTENADHLEEAEPGNRVIAKGKPGTLGFIPSGDPTDPSDDWGVDFDDGSHEYVSPRYIRRANV